MAIAIRKKDEMKVWYTLLDTVEYLNLSEKKIRTLVKSKKIRASQPEKKLLFHKTWLDAYVMNMGTRLTPTQKRELEELS